MMNRLSEYVWYMVVLIAISASLRCGPFVEAKLRLSGNDDKLESRYTGKMERELMPPCPGCNVDLPTGLGVCGFINYENQTSLNETNGTLFFGAIECSVDRDNCFSDEDCKTIAKETGGDELYPFLECRLECGPQL